LAWKELKITCASFIPTFNDASLFLDELPTELRIEISKLVLGGKEFIIHGRARYASVIDRDIDGYTRDHSERDFGLLLACRQIYSEAADILYACNDFTLLCRLFRDN
jgi:hypothetical protein